VFISHTNPIYFATFAIFQFCKPWRIQWIILIKLLYYDVFDGWWSMVDAHDSGSRHVHARWRSIVEECVLGLRQTALARLVHSLQFSMKQSRHLMLTAHIYHVYLLSGFFAACPCFHPMLPVLDGASRQRQACCSLLGLVH